MADKKIVLKNVEVSWAKLLEAGLKYKSETEYEFSVAVKANDQLRDLMKSFKLNKQFKSKDSTFDGEEFIQLTLDTRTKSGWVRHGEVFDEFGDPTKDLIGNGSTMNLFVSIGQSSYGNIIKLGHLEDMDMESKEMMFHFGQVMELVPFEAPSAVIKKEKEINESVEAMAEDEMEIPFG